MRRRALWLAGAAALCVIMAVLWAVWPRERLLLARATRVADATGWRQGPSSYWWLSDHQVLHFGEGSPAYDLPLRLDVRTNRDEVLFALASRIARPGIDATASPDGKWLLTRVAVEPGAESYYLCLSMDGRAALRGPTLLNSIGHGYVFRGHAAYWKPDSSGFVDVAGMGLSAVPEPDEVLDYDVAGGRAGHMAVARRRPVRFEPVGPITLGVLGDGGLLGASFATLRAPDGRADFVVYARGAASQPARFSVPIPRTVNGYTCILSPRGDRLAWIMRETRVPAVSTFWQRVKALVSGGAHPRIGLWVSRADGSGLREIGHIDQDPRQNRLPDVPRAVRWTPDEQRLSFLYHGALYTVPAD